MSGNGKFFNGWSVGSSAVWRVPLEDGQAAWRSALFEGFSLNWRTKCSSRGLPTEVQSVLFGREAAWRLRCQSCVVTALHVMLVDREAAWRSIWQTSKGTRFFVFVVLEDKIWGTVGSSQESPRVHQLRLWDFVCGSDGRKGLPSEVQSPVFGLGMGVVSTVRAWSSFVSEQW